MTTMNSRARRNVARCCRARHQRGAALLEGLVVAGTCLGLLGLGLAVHGRELTRLERERASRSDAWRQALAGCVEPDPVVALARAALQGRAVATAAELARVVHGPHATRRADGPGRVPCNEPAALAGAEWSNTPMDLERQLLPRLP